MKTCACGKVRCKNEHVEAFDNVGLWSERNSLWPTPTASPSANRTKRSRPSENDGRGHGRTLSGAVFSWPTPTFGGTGYKSGNKRNVWRPTLKSAALLDALGVHPSRWPTPTASLGRHGKSGRGKNAQGGPSLGRDRSLADPDHEPGYVWSSPREKSPTLRGLGQLNPSFVEALMGFPAGWID